MPTTYSQMIQEAKAEREMCMKENAINWRRAPGVFSIIYRTYGKFQIGS